MSALLAHDLRSPLNVISQSVTAWDRFPDKRDRMLRIIKENADRALSMIEGLRQSTREIVLDRKPTDLNKLLSSIVKETKIPDKVRRHLRVNGDLSAKMIDPAIIRRVLENLIWNAIDAMPGGGNLNITANGRHENIIIEVSDTGTGISDKDKTRIWEPFFTTKPKGFGLGLPFCRRAIEAHGGIIEFDSNVGEGTTFTITLPNKK